MNAAGAMQESSFKKKKQKTVGLFLPSKVRIESDF